MDAVDRAQFLEAIAEMTKLMERSQEAIQRARSRCHGELYEHVDLIAKRLHELRVRSEWLQEVVLGRIELQSGDAANRQGPDRRLNVDRRVGGMQKQVLSAISEQNAAPRKAKR